MSDRRVLFGDSFAILTVQREWKPGDQPPQSEFDYLGWDAWAEVQHKSGLRQKACGRCSKYRYPQEMSEIIDRTKARNRYGKPVEIASFVCNKCAAAPKEGA